MSLDHFHGEVYSIQPHVIKFPNLLHIANGPYTPTIARLNEIVHAL